MASNVIRDHHSLRRNLKLNGKYISNDGGDEGLSVTDDGDVGIGTTSQTAKLRIQETNMYHQFGNYSYYASSSLQLRVLNNGYLQMGTDGSNSVHFHTNGFSNKRMSITSSGDLGLGTTSPSSLFEIQGGLTTVGAVLTLSTKEPSVVEDDVLGRINFQAPLDTGADSDLVGASIAAIANDTFSDTVNSTDLLFQTGASETATTKMIVRSSGNVGIGTSVPGATLEVSGNIKISGTGNTLMTTDSSYFLFGANSEVQLIHDHNRGLSLLSSANDTNGTRLTFTRERDSSGTMSGGTTLAGQDNDEIGELLFKGYNDAGTPEKISFAKIVTSIDDASDGTEDGTIEMYTMASGTLTEISRFNATGLGIGTTNPATALHIVGDLTFDTSGGRDILFGDNLGAALEFKESGNLYQRFITTNSSEEVEFGQNVNISGTKTLTLSGDTKIASTKKLYLDGGGDSYIHESSADVLQVYTGGDKVVEITEATTGNKVDFGTTGVGFTQFEPTYNASDTNVTFNDNGNKAFVTFGAGNITDMNLYFPDISCNCVLLLKQDGTGSRTVTNWKTFDQADGNESTVVWAGGSAPTLTTTANKIDIISLYWDNDNHKAYGVASLNF